MRMTSTKDIKYLKSSFDSIWHKIYKQTNSWEVLTFFIDSQWITQGDTYLISMTHTIKHKHDSTLEHMLTL